jgi:aryl-alcohol dehydrogenase-like predicted oxidoreductase
MCYFSLASGFLTGKYRSERDFKKSARGQGMDKYLNERGHRILHALEESLPSIMPNPLKSLLRG